jgi:hypothetical protein
MDVDHIEDQLKSVGFDDFSEMDRIEESIRQIRLQIDPKDPTFLQVVRLMMKMGISEPTDRKIFYNQEILKELLIGMRLQRYIDSSGFKLLIDTIFSLAKYNAINLSNVENIVKILLDVKIKESVCVSDIEKIVDLLYKIDDQKSIDAVSTLANLIINSKRIQ